MKATEYKEKTLQALTRSDSPSKLNRVLCGNNSTATPSDKRLFQVVQDENRAPHDQPSPLRPLSTSIANIGRPGTASGISNYSVKKELEKLESSGVAAGIFPNVSGINNNNSGTQSNFTVSPYNQILMPAQPQYQQQNFQDYSPLRKKGDFSPLRGRQVEPQIANAGLKARGEVIDENYRRVRESCERIANVLGLSTKEVLASAPLTSSTNKPTYSA